MNSPRSKLMSCQGCKKFIKIPPYRFHTFKWCSRKCKNKFGCVEKIIAICKICKNKFEHISSRCNKAKYCSRKCYYKSQIFLDRGTQDYKCQYCEKIFKDSPSKNRKYCSIECIGKKTRSEWHPKFMTVRKKILREGLMKSCEKCGYNEFPEILGVHHIDENRKNNCKENLMVVCPMCHSLIHRKHISH